MPPRLFPYAFLVLSLGIISTFAVQDLRYYPDLIPDISSEEITLKRLERLLKSRDQNGFYLSRHFPHREEFAGKELQQRRALERSAKEFKGTREILDALSAENPNLIHALPKRVQKHISNYPASPVADGLEENEILREYPGRDRDPREFYPYFQDYPGFNGPLPKSKPRQNLEYQTIEYHPHHRKQQDVQEQGMKEEPLLDFRGKYLSLDRQNLGQRFSGRQNDDPEEPEQDFTYRFDEPHYERKEESSFASRPNDPGYYADETDAGVDFKDEERTDRILASEEDTEPSSKESVTVSKFSKESSNDDKDQALPELERRVDNHSPLVMAVDHKISNDIYFVAVVAGCSAAAMFILVLISLTWCRFQRGAKAAADVEYPAYGVTGPNKDTSPSGDRRLAQSAQMYHYQHQKQQIIAMESRTATARDPGSVSEPESDEENDEGDYTVYECPGLAPTGEMEVKNPLFHDDPTPATPAGQVQGQKNRSSEDHM